MGIRTNLVMGLTVLASGVTCAETTPAHISMKLISYASFAEASVCHVESVLYGKIFEQRANGVEKNIIQEKLQVGSAPNIKKLVDEIYDYPLASLQNAEQFYKQCVSKKEVEINKRIATMSVN